MGGRPWPQAAAHPNSGRQGRCPSFRSRWLTSHLETGAVASGASFQGPLRVLVGVWEARIARGMSEMLCLKTSPHLEGKSQSGQQGVQHATTVRAKGAAALLTWAPRVPTARTLPGEQSDGPGGICPEPVPPEVWGGPLRAVGLQRLPEPRPGGRRRTAGPTHTPRLLHGWKGPLAPPPPPLLPAPPPVRSMKKEP